MMMSSIALALMFVLVLAGAHAANARRQEDIPRYYLYGSDESDPVIDYHPSGEIVDEPDFLYGSNQGPHVVEFYFHACPHCVHYRKHYVQFAREIHNLTNGLVKCYGVSCAVNDKICRANNVSMYPTTYVYSGGPANQITKVPFFKLNVSVALELFKTDIERPKDGQIDSNPLLTNNTQGFLKVARNGGKLVIEGKRKLNRLRDIPWSHQSKQKIYDDVYLSFDFHLRNEIFSTESGLDKQSKIVLRLWLELLQKTLPSYWHMQTIVSVILKNFDDATSNEKYFINLLDQHVHPSLGQDTFWSETCSHGETGRGFTCGLWLLYHIMTIGVVEYNRKMVGDKDFISTSEAADTLKNYINRFFRCEDCRYHFNKEYDNCSFDRCHRFVQDDHSFQQSIQLPIWLVETHNGVTQRLLDDEANQEHRKLMEQEKSSKMWPNRSACPECWYSQGQLNHQKTYDFLKDQYWPSHLGLDSSRRTTLILPNISSRCLIVMFLTSLLGIYYYKNSRRTQIWAMKKQSLNGKIFI